LKIYIPRVGTQLVLSKKWSFNLYFDDSNHTMIEVFGGKKRTPLSSGWFTNALRGLQPEHFVDGVIPKIVQYERGLIPECFVKDGITPYIKVTLPIGTHLVAGRILMKEILSQVYFRVVSCPEKQFSKKRFWASLDDINNKMSFDIVGEAK
jgi:hypothetical protein